MAGIFILFALLSSFVAPRIWPDFPGRQGLSVFMIVSFVLFAAQLTAIGVLAVEDESEAHAAGSEGAAAGKTIDVQETEFKIELPTLKDLGQGEYTFVVHNVGQAEHDLVVEGPKLSRRKPHADHPARRRGEADGLARLRQLHAVLQRRLAPPVRHGSEARGRLPQEEGEKRTGNLSCSEKWPSG